MIGISDSSVTIQVSSQSVPSTPAWFGEAQQNAHCYREKASMVQKEANSDAQVQSGIQSH